MINFSMRDLRVMTYFDLLEFVDAANKHGFNRSIDLKKFFDDIKELELEPTRMLFPVYVLMIHEHIDGELVDPHYRVKIIGPETNDDNIMGAILDCEIDRFESLRRFRDISEEMLKETFNNIH